MTPAEYNYPIYDKELLAIVRSFKEFRLELILYAGIEDSNKPIRIYLDYKALEYFITSKKLNTR